MPLNAWAKKPGRVAKTPGGSMGSWSARGLGVPAASTTNVAQMAMLNARVDRQEAMFEAVLERLSTLAPPTSLGVETMPTPSVGPGIDLNAAAPLMQMAKP